MKWVECQFPEMETERRPPVFVLSCYLEGHNMDAFPQQEIVVPTCRRLPEASGVMRVTPRGDSSCAAERVAWLPDVTYAMTEDGSRLEVSAHARSPSNTE